MASRAGSTPSLTDSQVCALRDVMAARGPDAAGLWRRRNVVLAHRRLAVVDPTDGGAQPMCGEEDPATGAPRCVVVYNGELYNDAELRAELRAQGARFRTACDTETVVRAWERWGEGALRRLRGMFALGVYDPSVERLWLARDPLGIKPLYYRADGGEVMFASEPRVILSHPGVERRPNLRMVSAYVSTIRTVIGPETLFEGIRAVEPGTVVTFDLLGARLSGRVRAFWEGPAGAGERMTTDEAAGVVRGVVAESVQRHLRSDVPVCALLSGGLDSTITTHVSRRHVEGLRTYCAGSSPASCDDAAMETDLGCARRVAAWAGTVHAEAHVTRDCFADAWPWMVRELGVPLSTPNEVAIFLVASRLREDGCVVTISGEGADELFGGYEAPLAIAARYMEARARGDDARDPGRVALESTAWVLPEVKQGVMRPEMWEALEGDAWLTDVFDREMTACAAACGGRAGTEAFMRMLRRVNLSGLLQRLDTSTMLASVEGRTPLADARVAEVAERLPASMKFVPGAPDEPSGVRGGAMVATGARTKVVLRDAFRGELPSWVVERPKASFPLPFEGWLADQREVIRRSALLREVFTDAAVEAVAAHPGRLWNLAWPMANLGLWAG